MGTSDFDGISFYEYLLSKGYYFSKEIIENYLLSIKVKPFIIFTGNSGTGKTKLSQLFAKYLVDLGLHELSDDNFISVKVKSNKSSWKNTGWTLSSYDLMDFLPINECQTSFKMEVDSIHAEGNLSASVQLRYFNDSLKNYFYELYQEDKDNEVELKISCDSLNELLSDEYIEPNGSIKLKQNANKTSYGDREWTANYEIYNYVPFMKGYVPCDIIVNDMKVKGELRIIFRLSYNKNEVLENYLQQNMGGEVDVEIFIDKFSFDEFEPKYSCIISNYQIVPIGANWTDNTNIIGYFNSITEKHISTPAYELIIKSSNDLNNPYFLILDEMNLSHVERYFADFLSAIESKEPIPLYGNLQHKLNLPENLFIIGTVNVDETTYMFSPKVLDRANTIEFDILSANDYMYLNTKSYGDFEGDINYLQYPLFDPDISKLNIQELNDILSKISCNGGNLWDVLASELTSFQNALKGSGFDFGFRVINEILRFMVVAWRYEYSPDDWDNWERYFDAQIKQKILPKLHGSEKAIGNILTNLFNLCLEDRENNENPKNFKLTKDDSRYYTSALKLQNMSRVLSDQRYVSFIN